MSKISYTKHGDYLVPDLILLPEENIPVGMWGQRHLSFIQQHKKIFYTNLLTSGMLNRYLADINEQAETLFSRLVKELAYTEGVTEQLKEENPMEWVGRMNNVRSRAEEVVFGDLVFV